MATEVTVANLKAAVESLKAIDKERLLRKGLGEESLVHSSFPSDFDEILQRADFALQYARMVDEGNVTSLRNLLDQIKNEFDGHAKRSNTEYVSQRSNFLNSTGNRVEQLRPFRPPFVAAAIEARGFLQDEGIRKEYERTVSDLRSNAEKTLEQVKQEATKTIDEARKLAEDIEKRARRTATHISVEAAQEQFRLAQKDHKAQVILWGVFSILSVLVFVGVAIYFLQVKLSEELTWHILYYTAIRVTILTAIGAVATFCLRILRAHMHMSQHNLHRQRIANSMAAFVESAIIPEQRDLILTHLVDAVASFGSSGLLSREDDSIHSPKIAIDTFTRTLTSQSPKS